MLKKLKTWPGNFKQYSVWSGLPKNILKTFREYADEEDEEDQIEEEEEEEGEE